MIVLDFLFFLNLYAKQEALTLIDSVKMGTMCLRIKTQIISFNI